ncbi:AAA family ATPase [Pectobacterium parmentieri]|uniref:AAA family ATPase n=1 Tax=Pectobacterium parmentieri TaxID=1905730 RepID=UPI0018DFBD99|nr:AAA family ATPase [Pectobacterium parmentieri]MBI0549490.1 AAA family ATPase [Pectobacterium parmentieri]MBI0558428.1 AAA family ATPase [Pectobacterium parmentieri]MBI0562481.1 AAA family ATPase [Pectobacterium parmentieri]
MSEQLIKSIYVKGLFGLYEYHLGTEYPFGNAVILYGDNGVGKSTVLRLAFHLLSAHGNRGHRSELFKVKFEELKVFLESGVVFSALFGEKKGRKVLNLSIEYDNKKVSSWEYIPGGKTGRRIHTEDGDIIYVDDDFDYKGEYLNIGLESFSSIKNASDNSRLKKVGEKYYLHALKKLAPNVFILNADRKLESDLLSDPSDEVELRQTMKYGSTKTISDLVARSREIAVSQALNAANKWIARKAVLGTNQGSDNVHSVYINILGHLISPTNNNMVKVNDEEVESLIKQLKVIEVETAELAKYEFATILDMTEFEKVLSSQYHSQTSLPYDLLKPYIESLEGRLKAFRPIYKTVDKFISIVNELLTDKKIGFHLSQGFFIKNTFNEPLESSQLSSGEQQLLLLFCHVLVAKDISSVFMIDEPEISLNIKWQRQLVQALLDITEESNIQFIFASHSLEIISQNRNKVVKLVNRNA